MIISIDDLVIAQFIYDEAMMKFKEVITLDPKYTKAYINSGHVYFNSQKFDTGIIYYIKHLSWSLLLRAFITARGLHL